MLNDKANKLVCDVADKLAMLDAVAGVTEAAWLACANLEFVRAVSMVGCYPASNRHWKAAFRDLTDLYDEAIRKVAAKEADFRKKSAALANT